MKPDRKHRSDSRLKTLSAERQRQIIEWLKGPEGTSGTVRLVRDQFSVRTSATALSEFFSWWHLQQRFARRETVINSVLEDLRKSTPGISEEKLFEYGQMMFSAEAIEEKDPDAWAKIHRLRQKDESTKIEARRVALLEKAAQQAEAARTVTSDPDLSPEEKQSRMRQIFGLE